MEEIMEDEKKKNWWGEFEEDGTVTLTNRGEIELKTMRASFPNAKLTFRSVGPESRGEYTLHWENRVLINYEEIPEEYREHNIYIDTSTNYPFSGPSVQYDANQQTRKMIGSKHIFPYNNESRLVPCMNNWDGAHGWNPSKTTVATMMAWAIHTLWTGYLWVYTGTWIGAVGHDIDNPAKAIEKGMTLEQYVESITGKRK
jgi:hypothetical protein